MVVWEYRVVKISRKDHTEDVLNGWGLLGWECFQLCAIEVPSKYGYFAYFKKQSHNERSG